MLEQNTNSETRDSGAPPSPPLEISNAISRLHKHFVGRGPTNARTTVDGDLVVCLLEAVASALGRQVRSFMTANDLRRNLQVEVFVLEAE
jgi:uncharacterized protein YbcI